MTRPTNVLEVLQAARELIADEQHWCQKSYALNAEQVYTAPTDGDAIQWCALGALCNATADTDSGFDAAVQALLESDGTWFDDDTDAVIEFNDSHSHSEVIELFDDAIASQQRMVAGVGVEPT